VFPFHSVLSRVPSVRIIDVGAMDMGPDPYRRLADALSCQVLGFEPNETECAKLNQGASAGWKYLPYVIGDGTRQTFYKCAAPECSSLLEPNRSLTDRFAGFGEMLKVVSSRPVTTTRLDAIPEARGADFLKLDVQGGELLVLEGATGLLQDLLVIHTELEFVPLYKGQPLFADIDSWLRGRGFALHTITGFGARPFAPMLSAVSGGDPLYSQLLWCDAVYVRDFMQLETLSAEQLTKLAAIMHENYGSYDFVSVVLQALDAKTGSRFQDRYIKSFS
jgi:FkbM family methyltransferase